MHESRTVNALKNSFSGMINKLINISVPFITRTAIIYALGIEYVGLNGLFTSILQVLNLAELGISSAVVYCMYKPMAENDSSTLCALLRYMRRVYYIIGTVVILMGAVLIPYLPNFISGTVPDDLNISVLYLIYLINTGIGYFFFAYKATLLNAGQKVGVISNINSGIILFQGIAQIVVITFFKNYYLFLALQPIFTLLNNIFVSYATQKYYPDIICKGSLDAERKHDISIRIKGLFVTRICTTTRNAFDSIFISSFIGLTAVGIYGNYYYIMGAIVSLLGVITTAMTASVGNSLMTETIEKNYSDFRKFNFVFNWISGFCTCCLLTIYQPFMKIWMGSESLFPMHTVILICVYFYFLNIGSIRAMYHDAAGLWWEARYRAIVEAILNIVLNFMLTKRYGVFGTILGTLISLILVNYIWGTQIVFKYYFKTISAGQYFVDNLFFTFGTMIACIVAYNISSCFSVEGILSIFLPLVVTIVAFNGVYFLLLFKTKLFKQSIEMVRNIIKRFL